MGRKFFGNEEFPRIWESHENVITLMERFISISLVFENCQNVQFNETNHMLVTRWIVERWCAVERLRAMRKNPTLVIGQEKWEAAMRGPL